MLWVIAHLPVFVGTTVLMLVVPGPDFLVVTRNVAIGNRRQGYRTVVGICSGLAFLTLVTASGLATILATSTTMLILLRMLGGSYLILLGGMLMISAWRRQQPTSASNTPHNTRSPIMQGFLNNVFNPKAWVFYLTFMPQFLTSDGPMFTQTLLMGAVVVACATAWWVAYVTAIGFLNTALARSRVRTIIDAGAGAALTGLGAATLSGWL